MKSLCGRLSLLILGLVVGANAWAVTLTNASADYCDFCGPVILFIHSNQFSGESCPLSQKIQNKRSPMKDQKYILKRNRKSYGLQFEGVIIPSGVESKCFLVIDVDRSVDVARRSMEQESSSGTSLYQGLEILKNLIGRPQIVPSNPDANLEELGAGARVLTNATVEFCDVCDEPILFIESDQLTVESCALSSQVVNTKRRFGNSRKYVLSRERPTGNLTLRGRLIPSKSSQCFDIYDVFSNEDILR